ncbi:phage tail assembly chaperone family protein, TAC [Acinetobacter tandoii]|uniref:phage tail assembly chaperone family protein, TAC n=1 Tax=Acinetobacter tandoii TaxID=202954 RepID=UPI0030185002
MAQRKKSTAANSKKLVEDNLQAEMPTTVVELPRPKMDLKAIALGSLVGQVRDVVVQFIHAGQVESTDVRIKQLSYAVTEPLYTKLNKGEDVIAEWIALALVDENGESYLTKEQVQDHFTQSLASSVFSEITGLDAALRLAQGKMKSHQKMNSGANSLPTA